MGAGGSGARGVLGAGSSFGAGAAPVTGREISKPNNGKLPFFLLPMFLMY